MNQKLIVKNKFDKVVYCVLSRERPYEEQLMEVLAIKPGHGFSVTMDETAVRIMDYFHWEERGNFEILSLEPCEEPVVLSWQDLD